MSLALTPLYDRYFAELRAGRSQVARAALAAIVGFESVPASDAAPFVLPPEPPPVAPMYRYVEPRVVDLVALRAGARRVAKFEDLPRALAARLAGTLTQEGFVCVTAGPYQKRFDVSESRGRGGASYTLAVSRGDEARELLEAENDRSPSGTREVGRILGYPECCVERFIEVGAGLLALAEGINEAVIRAFAGDGDIDWRLNPLSTQSLVGFMPCGGHCASALRFASAIHEALCARGGDAARVVEATLRRAVLFFRYPLFYALDGCLRAGGRSGVLRYERAVLNDDGCAPLLLRAGLVALLEDSLSRGDGLQLEDDALVVWSGERELARFHLASPRVPLLLRPR